MSSLKIGSQGQAVKNLQVNLNVLGFKLTADGNFGPVTEKAVKGFQQSRVLTVDGVVGPITQAEIAKCLIIEASKPVPGPGDTSWMAKMESRLGIKEIPGSKDNPLIMEMYPYGNYPQQHDEVPWCAVCANWALITSGYKGDKSAAAVDFAKYGNPCELKYGCIIVIQHPSGGHHVTFCQAVISNEPGNIIVDCLGGNQSDSLKVSRYDLSGTKGKDRILATRWPVKA